MTRPGWSPSRHLGGGFPPKDERMNALVLLLMTSVPAADPLPATTAAPAPFPSYTYGQGSWSGQSEDSRPRFFGRIRGLFRRRSEGTNQVAPDTAPAYSSSWNTLG